MAIVPPAVLAPTPVNPDAGPDLGSDLRHAEALLQTGALQSAIFNSANFSSIATDARGVIQIFNVGAERMLGYAAADVVNRITPADISDPREVIARARELSLELGTPITPGFEALVFKASRGIEDIYELTYIRKDRSRFPAVVSVTALRDASEAIIGYLLIGTDNTARKQAEEALLKAGALQNAIFNSANFSSIATDAAGVIQIFNVGAQRMLGYAAAEVVNQITPADISDPEEVIARAEALSLELGTPITPGFEALVFKASRGIEDIYELTYFRKDGSRFPAVVSVTALRDAHDCIIGYLLIGTDNTARKQVEEERAKLDQRLRDQHFYTRSLIESNVDALMTTDPRGIITDVNKQTEALTGCTRDELIGAPFRNYFTEADRAQGAITRALTEGKVTNYELTARARDGKLTVVSYNATTFHDRDRRLQGVVAAARDMTELKRIERALQQKNVELEDASRMKSEFLANMSHELRTPLNAIIGFSEVLKDGMLGELTEQQRGFITDIFSSGTHLLSLINDILDLSKVEAGKMTLDLETVQVASLFANSLSIIREKAAARHVTVTMTAAPEVGWMDVDARKLKQIVYNLLSNAVKFSCEGGRVTRRDRHPRRRSRGSSFSDPGPRLRRVPGDPRAGCRHRDLGRRPAAAVPPLQPDRQRPRAKVRGDGPRSCPRQAPGRAARWRRGGGEHRRRRLHLHRLAAIALHRHPSSHADQQLLDRSLGSPASGSSRVRAGRRDIRDPRHVRVARDLTWPRF
jgi:PAS domain S-box-containing protein